MRFVEASYCVRRCQPRRCNVRQVNFGIPNLAIFSMLGRSPANPPRPAATSAFRRSYRVPARACWSTSGTTARTWRRCRRKATRHRRTGIPDELGTIDGRPNDVPARSRQGNNSKMRLAFARWVTKAAEHGWAEYRAPTPFQDLVAQTYRSTTTRCCTCARPSRTRWIQRHPVTGTLWCVAEAPEEELR
jgi:hypothetical protein